MRLATTILLALLVFTEGLIYADKPHSIQRFGADDLIQIRTMVRFTTVIVLPDGEVIAEVACGDKEYWVVEKGGDSSVHVKPAKEGATTNLHISSTSGTIYSFLLEEISPSKGRPAKEKPDFKVLVNPEPLSAVQKEKENLAELLARTERELKEQKEKAAEAERKRSQTKEEGKPTPKQEQDIPRADAAPTSAVPTSAAAPSIAQISPAPPAQTVLAPSGEEPMFRSYSVAREGVLEKTGRAFGSALRKVGRFFRIF